ncbi:MAG TPA: GNAT family N-acetyltransferase [Fimbriimonadales bacterium]|jgi:RimJ/RimL family protein N-acetyltransferase|nr:GNAT family N-acetyltransferase [Fimbriimonadales bacterium]
MQTDRLILRRLTEADIDFMAEMLADAEVMRYYPSTLDRSGAEKWIARQLARYEKCRFGPMLALLRDTDEPIGQIGLAIQTVDGVDETEVGYILHKRFWGKGYATEGARACVESARRLGMERIIALIRPENGPSMRVAHRLGMEFEKMARFANLPHNVMVQK